jgi:tRNA pseudouridine55 synthase
VPSLREIEQALIPLSGTVMQKPPDHSALKIKGQRAYDLARAGRPLKLAPRMVQIDRIEVLGYLWPHLELEIDCSKGTYIRSIARDVGEALGCGGFVQELKRTRIGPFTLEFAVPAANLSLDSIARILRPSLEAVAHLIRVVLDDAGTEAVTHGRAIALPQGGIPVDPPGLVALVDSDSRLVALAEFDAGQKFLQPRKVLIDTNL